MRQECPQLSVRVNFTNVLFAAGLDSLDQARADDEDYSKRFSFQNGGGDNLSIDEHKARAKESFKRLQV